MEPDKFHLAKCVLAMLLAMVAVAEVAADESFVARWSAAPFGSSGEVYSKPADEADSAEDSSRQTAENLRRLFLSEQLSVERPVSEPIYQAVEDPGYPRVGNLVQPAEESAAGGGTPSIPTAALIKADADLSMQKIKAVKYLATAGCECSSQSDKVRDALLAALDDCSEEVRYEAALAFCRSAGNPCSRCNRDSCCGDEVMDKLWKMAGGRDKNGCWCEPSCYVRAAARRALAACRRVRRHGPEVAPMPGPEVGRAPLPDDQIMEPEEPSLEDLAAAAPSAEASSLWATPSPTGPTLGMIGDFLGGPGRTATITIPLSVGGATAIGPTNDGMSAFQSSASPHTFLTPGAYQDPMHVDASGDGWADTWELTEVEAAPGSELLNYQTSGRLDLAPGSEAVFNGGAIGAPAIDGDVTDTSDAINAVGIQAAAEVIIDLPASGIRRMKIAENNSTLPRDRFFFNYSYFHNVMTGSARQFDINRFVFGVEKTFDHGRASIEVRIPFGSTLNSTQRTDGVEFSDVEFGNIGLLFKRILRQGDRYTFGAGLAMSFPTGDDTQLFRMDLGGTSNFASPEGTVKIMHLNNEAYRLMPWLGLRLDPNERLFVESFLQFDFGLNENSVFGHYDGPQGEGGTLPGLGQVYDQTLMLADVSVGYWLHRDRFKHSKLMGVVPNLELHYATPLQDPDVLVDPNMGLSVNSGLGRFDQLNLTAGTHFVFHRGGNITPAIVLPLLTGNNRQFDYELQVQMNLPF
jgi:hypothetical protein